MYRNNNNLNDLINRFEMTNEDDFDMTENVKYAARRKFKMQSSDESFGNDQNRSLMKYTSDRIFDGDIFVRTPTVSGAKEFVKQLLQKISALLEMISKFPFPRMSVMSFGLTSLLTVFLAPKSFTERVLYPGFKILFTIVYPAYRSFKAVRNKNLKEYLKWIVYWIVYAFFTCIELVTDALFNWFPFYYEIKVIFLIWLLGPSSKGAMKVYKGIIHPMLISREREIDDMIQLAQDYGYMQVFKLSSKSVNYANKIIMQDAKVADTNTMMMSHQLMKNISLSNISDAGTIQSNEDTDEILRMRRFSLDKMYEQRRKPSYDYRYDEMSSGYASPTQPIYRSQRSAYIEENIGSFNDISNLPRKASITELSDDEIIIAYHNLLKQKQQHKAQLKLEEEKKEQFDENYREFLQWMKMKQNDKSEKSPQPQAIPLNENIEEKVNTTDMNDEDIKFVADKTETSINSNVVSVPHLTKDDDDVDEFKDAISDEEDYLKVPLIIHEEHDNDDAKKDERVQINEVNAIIPTIVEEKSTSNEEPIKTNEHETESGIVSATLTLSNDPLQITANLSTSNMSLASSEESSNKKRPARHSKGRAPQPPTSVQSSSPSNVIEGYYFDELTKRHFKETEL